MVTGSCVLKSLPPSQNTHVQVKSTVRLFCSIAEEFLLIQSNHSLYSLHFCVFSQQESYTIDIKKCLSSKFKVSRSSVSTLKL